MSCNNPKKSDCKHCLGISHNELNEAISYCEEYDCGKNITLGDCFNNCEMQEKAT